MENTKKVKMLETKTFNDIWYNAGEVYDFNEKLLEKLEGAYVVVEEEVFGADVAASGEAITTDTASVDAGEVKEETAPVPAEPTETTPPVEDSGAGDASVDAVAGV